MNVKRIFLALLITAAIATTLNAQTRWSGYGRTVESRITKSAAAKVISDDSLYSMSASSFAFTPISVCPSCSTQPIGINEKGVITGSYFDGDGNSHGFLLRNGNYVSFDVPDALFVEFGRSNTPGHVVGDYVAQDGIDRPVVRNPDGSLSFRKGMPGASVTYAIDINNAGDITGSFTLDPTAAAGFTGYVMRGKNFTQIFSFPRANVISTFVLGWNEAGTIVGSFKTTTDGEEHGFVRTAQGSFKQIDYPGAVQTEAFGINAAGDIVGRYEDTHGVQHGFLLRNGLFTSIDSPGPNTYAWGINSRGEIVGWTFPDFSGPFTGFLAR
jgi:probable HAF family extracellular repeat protein